MTSALGFGQRLCDQNMTGFSVANTEYFSPEFKATAIKVGLYVARVFAKIADFVTSIIPPFSIFKRYNEHYTQSLNDEINSAQLGAYRESLIKKFGNREFIIKNIGSPVFAIQKIDPLVINDPDYKEASSLKSKDIIKFNKEVDKFNSEFNDILKKIIMSEDEENGIRAEDIRNAINDLVQSDIYKTGKSNENQLCIQILKLLAYAGTTANATKAIIDYGKKVREESAGAAQTTNGLAGSLNELNSNPLCFNRNHRFSKIWWAINHLETLIHLGVSNHDPLAFEAEKGNLPFQASTIKVPGIEKAIPLTFGPTPTDPIYFKTILRHLHENNKTEVRFILQDTKGSEGKRVAEFYKKTEGFRESGALSLITLPFDMQPMKDPAGFMGEELLNEKFSIDGFMSKYAEFITKNCRDENIFNKDVIVPIIPEEILSDEDLNDCFDFTQSVFYSRFPHSNLNRLREKEKIEIATSMQLFTQSIMVVKALSNIGKGDREIASLNIACKQCVDRAVALISSVVLLNEISSTENSNSKAIISNDPMFDFKQRILGGIKSPNLSGDICDFIYGIVMGRAQIVDQRLMMANRFKVLKDFINIVFGNAPSASNKINDKRDEV